MKFFTTITTLALAVCAVAVDSTTSSKNSASTTSSSGGLNSVSVFAVLATALPSSLLDLAITNPAEATKVIASEFAAGETPSWFTQLPKNIQTYLVPVTTIKQAPGLFGSVLPTQATLLQTVTLPSSLVHHNTTMRGNHTIFRNSTMSHSKTYNMPSMTSTMKTTSNGAARFTGSTTSSQGGAAAPTAVIGAGLAGVVGLVGMFAL